MEDDEAVASLVEERNEMMVSLFDDSNPILRAAHFLQPSFKSAIDEELPKTPLLSSVSLPPTFEPKKWGIKIDKGWVYPSIEWEMWVDYLRPKFESVWKEAGICEAIMCSTQHIEKDENLIVGIAEKWCPETNTIIFPWGEATLTLEDVMILGGYAVSGFSITQCSVAAPDLKRIEQKLKNAKIEIGRGAKPSTLAWLKRFMKSESEIEHEAFLTYWIARFVFPVSIRVIKDWFFPLAIHLARGRHFALGPAVLASIYKDLTDLKNAIVASTTKFDSDENVSELKIWSPLGLLQMWAFERFPELYAKPNMIKIGDPRAALWNNVKMLKINNIRSVLDSGGETFRWRPYTIATTNWKLPKFYKDDAEWIVGLDSNSDKEISSYVFCLRPSELVGMGYIEQYSPHRVAIQFGIDQDIPGHVERCNENTTIAWRNYARGESKLYLPSRFFESDVTTRYLNWWKQSASVQQHETENDDVAEGVVRRKRSSVRKTKREQWVPIRMVEKKNRNLSLDYPLKCNMAVTDGFTIEKKRKIRTLADIECSTSKLQGPTNIEATVADFDMLISGGEHENITNSQNKSADNNLDSPPGFFPKCAGKMACDFVLKRIPASSENITDLQDKSADNNFDTPPGFFPKCAEKMVCDFVLERIPASSSPCVYNGSLANGEDSSCRISVHSDVFSKNIPEMVKETQTGEKNGAEFGILTTRALVNSSNESGVGSSMAVGGNVFHSEKDESSSCINKIIPGFELEEKINKLEKVFAELKKIYAADQ